MILLDCSDIPSISALLPFIEIQFPGLKFPKVNVTAEHSNISLDFQNYFLWEPAGSENATKHKHYHGGDTVLSFCQTDDNIWSGFIKNRPQVI